MTEDTPDMFESHPEVVDYEIHIPGDRLLTCDGVEFETAFRNIHQTIEQLKQRFLWSRKADQYVFEDKMVAANNCFLQAKRWEHKALTTETDPTNPDPNQR